MPSPEDPLTGSSPGTNGSSHGLSDRPPKPASTPRVSPSGVEITLTRHQFEPSAAPDPDDAIGRLSGQGSSTGTREKSFTTDLGTVTCPEMIGEYRVIDLIGRGGMGNVFKVQNPFLSFPQALKMLDARLDSRAARQQFIDEMRTQAELEHTNIAKVHYAGVCRAAGRYHDQLYFVMGLEKGDLGEAIKRRGPYPPAEAANVVRRLAKAIGLAHARGTFHCDLKPKNILLAEDGTPKVTDFGLVKLLANAQDGRSGRGHPFGTPSYMPPEQAAGEYDRVDARSDVYGLAAILYELLTARPPFQGKSREQILLRVEDPKVLPEPIRAINPAVPARLEAICLKGLAKDPADRYATAAELERELERFARPGWLRRHWKPVAVAAGFLGLSAVVGALWYEQYAGPRTDARAKARQGAEAGGEPRLAAYKDAVAKYDALLGGRGVLGRAALQAERDRVAVAELTARADHHVERREYADAMKAVADARGVLGDGAGRELELAEVCHVEGNCHAEQDRWADAMRCYEAGRDLRLAAARPPDHPDHRAYLRDLARSHGYLGDAQTRAYLVADAKASYERARDLREHLAATGTDADRCFHARDDGNFAELCEWQGGPHLGAALAHRRNRLAYYRAHLSHLPTLPAPHRTERAGAALGHVELLLDWAAVPGPAADRFAEADRLLRDTDREFQALAKAAPAGTDPAIDAGVAKLHLAHARYALAWGRAMFRPARAADAAEHLQRATDGYERLDREKKARADDYYDWAAALALRGQLADDDDRRTESFVLALDRLDRAIEARYARPERLKRDHAFAAVRLDPVRAVRLAELADRCAEKCAACQPAAKMPTAPGGK